MGHYFLDTQYVKYYRVRDFLSNDQVTDYPEPDPTLAYRHSKCYMYLYADKQDWIRPLNKYWVRINTFFLQIRWKTSTRVLVQTH